ncbi:hypothetical protein AB840_09940 [Megasphaera cerevisiae DSM 20462]|uniref:Acyltransferase 3 domain-containing protein n=1 Tax=Megasphaera cerevisiae DSM 20462 TaxID=1122219 RepID=A0A0J6WW89_9FIRM|nr:acyltransferase family protein [Megasphaera cerevisiae]KMO86057.1 hypothetical protein AB840_09940 [Megasphaera cerevisiae DSM 20462]SKA01499.1 Acyltransferase family protein [Megasphaera cerevisiae DSM 20462]
MTRNMGIELYRVFSMFFIIMFHFSDHGAVAITAQMPFSFNWLILAMGRVGGGLGNCAFVLISGYLLINKEFHTKRIVKLWFEVWTYSVVLGIVAFMIKTEPFSIGSLVHMLFPVTYNQYWYMSTYIVMMLLTPFLNPLFLGMTKMKYRAFIVIGEPMKKSL